MDSFEKKLSLRKNLGLLLSINPVSVWPESDKRGKIVFVARDRVRASTLTIKTLCETGQHLDDAIIAGAQFLVGFVRNIFQISGEK